MKVSEINLKENIKFDFNKGEVFFGPLRLIIINYASFEQLLKEVIDTGGIGLGKVVFRRFGEAAGREDAKIIKKEFKPDTDIDWIAMGPAIHTWEGIVKATPTALEFDREKGTFFMQGKWEKSFIAELWLKLYGASKEPVCWMLSGYATGYASEFFGKELLCKETMCVGKGDPHCEFTIKTKEEWDK